VYIIDIASSGMRSLQRCCQDIETQPKTIGLQKMNDAVNYWLVYRLRASCRTM